MSLAADIRRGRERHRQDVLIGKLWTAVKRIPAGSVMADPVNGCRVSVERDGGFLILAVADPPDHPEAEATVARYTLGYWSVQARPPLYRHLAGIRDSSPARMRWQQRERLAEFNAITQRRRSHHRGARQASRPGHQDDGRAWLRRSRRRVWQGRG